MAKEYASGFRFFDRKDNQPEFVLGAIVITPGDLAEWAINNPDKVTDYKGKAQVKFQVKKTRDGKVFVELDTWKPGSSQSVRTERMSDDTNDLPF